jgi:hypothetical protein
MLHPVIVVQDAAGFVEAETLPVEEALQLDGHRAQATRGRLLVRTRFVRGTGLDAWFTLGRLSETRACVDGDRHGFERWWSTRRTIWSEAHYVAGREHGVFREWRDTATNTATASLRRGFPHFWIHGTRVTRRAYTRALATDATLPPLDARDDSPRRTAPRVIERP